MLFRSQTEGADPEAGAHIDLAVERLSTGAGDIGQGRAARRQDGKTAYQKGFKTERQGCLQVTGSKARTWLSGLSFRGVYRAPMGTTSLEASCGRVS